VTNLSELSQAEQNRLEEAASWRLRLQEDVEAASSADFLEWIRDAANREAFDLVSAGLDAIDQFQASPEMLAVRQETIGYVRRRGAARWRPLGAVWRVAAAVLVLAAITTGGVFWYLQQPLVFETAIGERHSVTLEDGSRISLDSDTEVKVRFTKDARNLELVKGRARFEVAHDVSRPFSVRAGTETVVAVGTVFDVERLGPKVLVTLIQGRVAIKSSAPQLHSMNSPTPPSPRPPVALVAGQELVASVNTQPVIRLADMQVARAWEAGQLVFHNETLAEAVDQVNRYAARPIVVDPSIANIRVSGVFNAGDISSFLTTVTTYLPIVASTTSDNQVLLAPRGKGG